MGMQEGIQDIVNEAVEAETSVLKRRILNLEIALRDAQELLLEITRSDVYEVSELMHQADDHASYIESVLAGDFE